MMKAAGQLPGGLLRSAGQESRRLGRRAAGKMNHIGNRGGRARNGSEGSEPGVGTPLSSVLGALSLLGVLCGSSSSCAGSGAFRGGAKDGPAALATSEVSSPSAASAETYTTSVLPAMSTDPLSGRIATGIDGGRRKRGQPPLVRDGRLDRVAHDIARLTGGRQAPAPDAVAFLLWHYGIVEPEPNLFLVRGDDGAEDAALAALQPQFVGAAASPEWRRVGIGVSRKAGQWSAVVVFQEKNLEIDPVPREIRSGAHVTIAGRIREAFRAPEVLITPPRGSVERPPTTVHRDAYSANLECNAGRGAYQVEISAQDSRGPRVLANFPVYCGVPPPAMFALGAASASSTMDPVEVERQILELMDRDRQDQGLPTLVRDARLAAIARRYSREMADTGEVAHFSPRTGSVVDRLLAAGVAPMPTIVAENVGSAASAADAEKAFMGSPGHRDNILNPAVTHIGIGVAVGREEGGTVPLFFTQIFAGWGK